ncbi:MAG: diguanylate cyclase, partial [Mobilitalea sp.]
AYFYNSIYEQALKYLFKARDLLEKVNDDFLMSCVLNNIGEVFRESLKYRKSIEYFNKALELCEDNKMRINEASLLGNIGEIYFLEEKQEKALEYFMKSYNLIVEDNDMLMLGEAENKLGKVYYLNGNYEKAEELFSSALQRLEGIENKFYAVDVLINIAKLHFERDRIIPDYYFEKAILYAEKVNSKKKLSEVYQILADCLEKAGDYEAALGCFKKYHRLEKEISTLIVGNKFEMFKIEMDYLNGSHKFENSEMINQRLEIEIYNQKMELKKIQKLNSILEGKAFEDELTGVPNRRHINSNLNKLLEESVLQDHIISLFIIDIDMFKKYNDTMGHVEGDRCLIKIANCLKDINVIRNDTFGRYGGEEFVYYAMDITYNQANELGNLFRTMVEKLSLRYKNGTEMKLVTISVGGVIGRLSEFKNISDIIRIADQKLYQAKEMGRNITCIEKMLV